MKARKIANGSSSTRANAAIPALVAPVVALDVFCGQELGLRA